MERKTKQPQQEHTLIICNPHSFLPTQRSLLFGVGISSYGSEKILESLCTHESWGRVHGSSPLLCGLDFCRWGSPTVREEGVWDRGRGTERWVTAGDNFGPRREEQFRRGGGWRCSPVRGLPGWPSGTPLLACELPGLL